MAGRLTNEQREALMEDIRNGLRNIDICRKYGISDPAVGIYRKRLGIPSPKAGAKAKVDMAMKPKGMGRKPIFSGSALESLNQDIMSGMSMGELRKKHGLSDSGIYKYKKRIDAMANGHEPQPELPPLSDDQRKRLVGIIGVIADRHPSVFNDMIGSDFVQRLARRHPLVLLEVM